MDGATGLAAAAIFILSQQLTHAGRGSAAATDQARAARRLGELIGTALGLTDEELRRRLGDTVLRVGLREGLAARCGADQALGAELGDEIRRYQDSEAAPMQDRSTNSTTVLVGDRTRGGVAGRDINNRRTTVRLGAIAVVAGIVIGVFLAGRYVVQQVSQLAGPSITEASTCRDYLLAPTEAREEAVKRIGLKVGATGAAHPFARLNVDAACGHAPDTPVVKIIRKQNY